MHFSHSGHLETDKEHQIALSLSLSRSCPSSRHEGPLRHPVAPSPAPQMVAPAPADLLVVMQLPWQLQQCKGCKLEGACSPQALLRCAVAMELEHGPSGLLLFREQRSKHTTPFLHHGRPWHSNFRLEEIDFISLQVRLDRASESTDSQVSGSELPLAATPRRLSASSSGMQMGRVSPSAKALSSEAT